MPIPRIAVRSAKTVVTGVVGTAAYHGLRRMARRINGRQVAVTSVAWGLRNVRRSEMGAETVRLKTADIVAEARERLGETAPAPTGAGRHDHDEH